MSNGLPNKSSSGHGDLLSQNATDGYNLTLSHDPATGTCSYQPGGPYLLRNGQSVRIALGTGFTSDAFIFKVQFYRPKSKEQPELPGEPLQEVRNPSIPEIGLMTAMGGLITEPPSDGKPEVKLYEVMTDQKARTVTIKDVEPETGSDDYYHFSLQIKMGGKLYGHDPELINKGGGSK